MKVWVTEYIFTFRLSEEIHLFLKIALPSTFAQKITQKLTLFTRFFSVLSVSWMLTAPIAASKNKSAGS